MWQSVPPFSQSLFFNNHRCSLDTTPGSFKLPAFLILNSEIALSTGSRMMQNTLLPSNGLCGCQYLGGTCLLLQSGYTSLWNSSSRILSRPYTRNTEEPAFFGMCKNANGYSLFSAGFWNSWDVLRAPRCCSLRRAQAGEMRGDGCTPFNATAVMDSRRIRFIRILLPYRN